MQNYPPTPTPLPATIPLPQDAVDDVVVATVRPSIEAVADAVTLTQTATVCHAYIAQAGSPIANNGHMELGLNLSYPSGGVWLLSSDEIQVPRVGVYSVRLKCAATNATSGTTTVMVFRLMVGAAGEIAWATGERDTTANTDACLTVGEGIIAITDPATQKLWVKNTCGVDANVADGGGGGEAYLNPLVITYLGVAA